MCGPPTGASKISVLVALFLLFHDGLNLHPLALGKTPELLHSTPESRAPVPA